MRAVFMFVEKLIKVMVRIMVEFPVVEHFFYNQSQHSSVWRDTSNRECYNDFLALTGAQETLSLIVRSFNSNLSRAVNLHCSKLVINVSGAFFECLSNILNVSGAFAECLSNLFNLYSTS